MRVLIAEDERATAHLLKTILARADYEVSIAGDGAEALSLLRETPFDALLTDWDMPKMDGMRLIEEVRRQIRPTPLIIMVTIIDTLQGRLRALDAGADDYVAKPIRPMDLLERLEEGLTRLRITRKFLGIGGVIPTLTPAPKIPSTPPRSARTSALRSPTPKPRLRAPTPPPRLRALTPTPKPRAPKGLPRALKPRADAGRGSALVVAASTGGPRTLVDFFRALEIKRAPAFIVLHGPGWMLEAYTKRLEEAAKRPVYYVNEPLRVEPEAIYLAPGDRHIHASRRGAVDWIVPFDGPKENFVRPAADPLFRTAAEIYKRGLVAVVLTGMGRDGTRGAVEVVERGGLVYAQEPESAVAPSMPTSVAREGLATHQAPPAALAREISKRF